MIPQHNKAFASFITTRLQLLILILIPLSLYYPLMSAGFNSLDDGQIVTSILNSYQNYGFMSWVHLFFRKSASYYYRPLVQASFILDQNLHFCTPSLMHIENIMLHIINGIIVFYIGLKIIKLFNNDHFYLVPFFTALIFMIHPVNTEAVDWIAARTDLMAGLFVFLSFLFLIDAGNKKRALVFSSVFYLFGLLSKESAIGLLPAAGIFLCMEYCWRLIGKKEAVMVMVSLIAISGIYTAMRKPPVFLKISDIFKTTVQDKAELKVSPQVRAKVDTKDDSVNSNFFSDRMFRKTASKCVYNTGLFFRIIGFYFKKLFYPWPLNFAIMKINKKICFSIGVMVMILIVFFIKMRWYLYFFPMAWSFCFMMPPMAVVYFHTAWTPLAERYVYISSFGAAFIFALVIYYGLIVKGWPKILILVSAAFYMAVFGYSTFTRNIIWQSNLKLYRDTVKKSCDSPVVLNQYGLALWHAGYYEKARKQFKAAEKLSGKNEFKYIEKANRLIAQNLIAGTSAQRLDFSDDYYNMAMKTKKSKIRLRLLKNAIDSSEKELLKTNDKIKTKAICRKQIKYFLAMSRIKDKAFYYYKIGQRYLTLDLNEQALSFFKKSARFAPNTYYGKAAQKLVIKLEKTLDIQILSRGKVPL